MRNRLTTYTEFGYPFFLFITAIVLTITLSTGRVTADSLLFQSPPETEEQPVEPETTTPVEEQSAPVVEPQEVVPAQEVPTLEPSPTPEPLPTPLELQPEPFPQPTVAPSNEVTPTAEADSEEGTYTFNRAKYVDTLLIFGSWIWLCCGMVLFLAVPIVLLIIQIRGSSKLRRQQRRPSDQS